MSERTVPRLVFVVEFEGRGRARIEADSHEDELRLRRWLRVALRRREPLTRALEHFLDDLDEREAA